ncbi:hypothetical protein Aph01nite_14100 [Acrocarpospora phusangensis]|uniref:Protein kinase domain-containing protein n=1 Tax=Acrocarpospora phusangensis TaxID=1070424 RepID=A0A919Q9C4_9ACTN|nr:hypothetical protein [Acrocarpospora phusangensis]GIH23100.1 hypothetical protein Aph01nite_14100 [Acrocarpospora phusangensis]
MKPTDHTTERIFLLDPYGKPLSLTALDSPPLEPGTGPFAERTLVRRTTGERFTMRYVPRAAGASDPGLYALLENEIRIGVRLTRRLGAQTYPDELARLVAYDADGEEPCVVFPAYSDEPAAAFAGQLLLDQQRAFQVSLFRGLDALHRAGVVHGGIGGIGGLDGHADGAAVTWDGDRVRMGGFGRATLRGEAAPPLPAPWGAPERRGSGHPAHPGSDIWSAALLVFMIATGKRVEAMDHGPDLDVGGPALRNLLQQAFDPEERSRPTAAAMLARLRAEPLVLAAQDGTDQRFAEGLRRYDAEVARRTGPPQPPPPPARRFPLRWALIGLVLVIGGLVAAGLIAEL